MEHIIQLIVREFQMRNITTRQDFITYCLRRLGAPVITINVATEQINDRIDDAIQKFIELHVDGSRREYWATTLTAQNIATGVVALPQDLNIIEVVRLMPAGVGGAGLGGTNIVNNAVLTDLIGGVTGSIGGSCASGGANGTVSSWTQLQNDLASLNAAFTRHKEIRFSFFADPKSIKIIAPMSLTAGSVVIFELFIGHHPDDHPNVWNNRWLQAYATALIKYQWASNLSKYANLQLPGGVSFDVNTMMSEAKDEIAKLEEELLTLYSMPALGFLA